VAGLLLVWEPLNFAALVLQVGTSLAYRGWVPVAELAAHGIIAALCVAAGMMLLNGAPDARRVAAAAIVLSVARVVQSLYWTALPNSTVPGDEPLQAALSVCVGVLALVVLRRPEKRSGPPSR
jgi:hypothetical protein